MEDGNIQQRYGESVSINHSVNLPDRINHCYYRRALMHGPSLNERLYQILTSEGPRPTEREIWLQGLGQQEKSFQERDSKLST
jgi:hypothetical protein